MYYRQNGFTLIELMVVIAIAAILITIAIPSYKAYSTNSRRTDGQIALLDLSTRLERYFTENNTYAGAAIPAIYPATSPEGFYRMQIETADATSYTLRAIPQGAQATDDITCATLTYNSLSQKGATGNTANPLNCW